MRRLPTWRRGGIGLSVPGPMNSPQQARTEEALPMSQSTSDARDLPADTGLTAFYREMTLPERRTFWACFSGLRGSHI